jgi:hypothetical protein
MSKYGFDKDTKSEGGGFKLAGRTDGWKLSEVKFSVIGKKEDGAKGLIFTFSKGSINFDINFFPIKDDVVKNYKRTLNKGKKDEREETEQEAIDRAYTEQNGTIKHIVTKFVSEEQAVITGVSSFEEYANAIITLLTPLIPTATTKRLKLSYNNKGFLGIPKYGRFIEDDSVPFEKTSLDWDPKYDSDVKPTADEEGVTTEGSTEGGKKKKEW